MSDQKTVRQPPAGYKRLTALGDAPWFLNQAGNTADGKLIGRYVMKTDPPRAYYQLELKDECTVRVGKGQDVKIVQAAKGDIINIGESYKLAILKDKVVPECNAGAEYNVYVQSVKKIPVGTSGRSMWDMEVGAQCIKPPTQPVRPLSPDEANIPADEGESDAPF
jgi:hypothetical protein